MSSAAKDYRSIGLAAAITLIACLNVIETSGLYNFDSLKCGIQTFKNNRQIETIRKKIRIEIDKMIELLIEYEMYELANALVTIVSHLYSFHDMNENNINNNPKKSTLIH